MKLYKRTIVIWTDYDASSMDLGSLLYDAQNDEAFITYDYEVVEDSFRFPDWDKVQRELV